MRLTAFIIGLAFCVLFSGCTTISFFTHQEESALSNAVKKIGRGAAQIDVNDIVRIEDKPFVNQFIIPDELRRQAIFYSGCLFSDFCVYTLYGRFNYWYNSTSPDYDFNFKGYSEYESSDLPGFEDFLCTSRSKIAQALFVKSRQEYPWLDLIEGDYVRMDESVGSWTSDIPEKERSVIRFKIQGDCCSIFSIPARRAFSFYEVVSTNTIKVVVFNSFNRKKHKLLQGVIHRFGSPILTNGFSSTQLMTISFKDNYCTLILDGKEYRDSKKSYASNVAKQAEECARKEAAEVAAAKTKEDRKLQEAAHAAQVKQAKQTQLLREAETLFAENDFTKAMSKAGEALALDGSTNGVRFGEITDFLAQVRRTVQQKAEQGDAKAQFYLGCCYDSGRGVSQNSKEAVKWFRLSADQGNADAQNNLATAYYYGWGVPQDYQESVKWLRLAAKQGNANAQDRLNSEVVELKKKDYVAVLRKKAEQGDAEAQYEIGHAAWDGKGVPKDRVEAMKLLRQSSAKGNGSAKSDIKLITKFAEMFDGCSVHDLPSLDEMYIKNDRLNSLR